MQTKLLNQYGDYYYCSDCNRWHRLKLDSESQQHLIYFDEIETNISSASYYFCSSCMGWHRSSCKAHLNYRAYVKADGTIELLKPSVAAKKERALKESIIGEFDDTDGVWKSFDEHIDVIASPSLRQRCMEILDIGRLLEEQKVQCFSRKDGFSFMIRGLQVGRVHVKTTRFSLTLKKNIYDTMHRGNVKQEEDKYLFTGTNMDSISNSDIRAHLLKQSQTLLALRSRNAIGYMEKWLHCLLIEHMDAGGLPELGLDFLYYEAPLRRVKRKKQFGREHADILARDRDTGAIVAVEVKMDAADMSSVIKQGMSYVNWIRKHRHDLAPRIRELGWDVEPDQVKLYVVAPCVNVRAVELTREMVENCGDCHMKVLLLNKNWFVDERVQVVDECAINPEFPTF